MTEEMLLAVGVLAVVALAAVIFFWLRHANKHKHLRSKFGPEYDVAVRRYGNKSKAERALAERTARTQSYLLRKLQDDERHHFSSEWMLTQSRFVDDPEGAVERADDLVSSLMEARGYPMSTFELQAEDLSVDHPLVVRHYRAAHEIALSNSKGRASTEDLRQAMVHYRELFADLLGKQTQTLEVHL